MYVEVLAMNIDYPVGLEFACPSEKTELKNNMASQLNGN